MVKSVGLDIVEVKRIKDLLDQYDSKFVLKILSKNEIELYEKRPNDLMFLAGRFAAKEAIIKGLGVYLSQKPPFNEIEVLNDGSGRPVFNAADMLGNKKVNCLLSISHEKNYAAAVAVFTEEV